MKMTLTFADFCDNWPESRTNQFSYKGKKALFDYLNELEEETGDEIEFDPIALCCDYSEYDNFEELKAEYNNIETMEDLENKTIVIKLEDSDGLIIQRF